MNKKESLAKDEKKKKTTSSQMFIILVFLGGSSLSRLCHARKTVFISSRLERFPQRFPFGRWPRCF